jgi:hypothetical protein
MYSFLDFDSSYTPIIHQETIASSVHPQYQSNTYLRNPSSVLDPFIFAVHMDRI